MWDRARLWPAGGRPVAPAPLQIPPVKVYFLLKNILGCCKRSFRFLNFPVKMEIFIITLKNFEIDVAFAAKTVVYR